jgi:hypothetical protein
MAEDYLWVIHDTIKKEIIILNRWMVIMLWEEISVYRFQFLKFGKKIKTEVKKNGC